MSNDKIIEKVAYAKFKVRTKNIPNSTLSLDFNPIIEEFKLEGNYYLIHWQARPKWYREWGVYHSQDDSYRSLVSTSDLSYGAWQPLQLNDKTANTLPSAVVYFEGALTL